MTKRVETLTKKQLLSRLNGAYKRILTEQDGKMIIQDIVSFSELEYHPDRPIDTNALLIAEGRRQMAMHILKHLDLEPREIIEALNDAAIINDTKED